MADDAVCFSLPTADGAMLLTLKPLACITAAALGLTMGTRFSPGTASYLFGVIALP